MCSERHLVVSVPSHAQAQLGHTTLLPWAGALVGIVAVVLVCKGAAALLGKITGKNRLLSKVGEHKRGKFMKQFNVSFGPLGDVVRFTKTVTALAESWDDARQWATEYRKSEKGVAAIGSSKSRITSIQLVNPSVEVAS